MRKKQSPSTLSNEIMKHDEILCETKGVRRAWFPFMLAIYPPTNWNSPPAPTTSCGTTTSIITGCCIFSVGCICQTASTTLALMVVGRLIAGLGVGFISAISKCSLPIRLVYVGSSTTYLLSVSHSLHVRNRTKEGSRRSCCWLPILYYHWHPHGQLRRLRHTEPR